MLLGEQWMHVRGQQGNDTYNLSTTPTRVDDLEATGLVRLDFSSGFNLVANLETGVIAEDGFGSADTVNGYAWELRATDGNDSVVGSLADESFILRQGNDTIDGGAGFDRLRYDRFGVDSAIAVDWTAGTVTGEWSGQQFLHNFNGIEWVRGSQFDDVMVGDAGGQTLSGEGGNDTLTGGAGADKFSVGSNSSRGDGGGTDVITDFEIGTDALNFDGVDMTDGQISRAFANAVDTGNGGAVFFNDATVLFQNLTAAQLAAIDPFATAPNDGTPGPGGGGGAGSLFPGTRLDGDDGADLLDGTDGPDVLTGNGGNDTLNGGGASDDLIGNDGDDLIRTGENEGGVTGFDFVVPGFGSDTVDMSGITDGYVRVDYSFLDGSGSGLSLGPVPIRANIDGAANTGSVDIQGFGDTDTFVDVANPLNSPLGGFSIAGSSADDTFNINTAADQFIDVIGNGGSDSYNITGDGIVRLTYFFASGINADLAAGTVEHFAGGIDTINGDLDQFRASDGNDSILGSALDEVFMLRGGTDTVDGAGGTDTLRYDRFGVQSPVTVNFGTGEATGTFNDAAFRHDFSNIEAVRGSKFDDTIIGSAGVQTISGNAGDDTLTGGAGADEFRLGHNSISVAGTNGGTDTITDFEVGLDVLDFEGLGLTEAQIGTSFVRAADTGQGAFVAFADGSNLFLEGLSAAQLAAMDPFAMTPNDGTTGPGGSGEADFPGTELANLLTGTAAAESFDARGGNDWINAGGGSDTVDGGAGRDMLSLYNVPDTPGRTNVQYRLEVDMAAGTAVSHDGSESVTFSGIERFTASIYADRIRGSDGDDEIRGLGDYDWFIATPGNDSIDGGTGQDMISFLEYQSSAANVIGDIFGSNGLPPTGAQVSGLVMDLADPTNNTELAAGLELTSVERVTGSVRQDVFWGDDGQNDFRGLGDFDWFVSSEGGRERYFGGNGFDTVTYFNAPGGIVASLSNGATVNGQETGFGDGGWAARDLYFEIENLVGSRFDDRLTGSSERNQLNGLEGDDFIFGLGDTDYMMGGAGNDVIDGGDGADYALFSGNSTDYTLTRAGNEVTVTGADGTDRLIDVEYFRFDNGDVTIWEL